MGLRRRLFFRTADRSPTRQARDLKEAADGVQHRPVQL
jgi:hypothetical protein